MFTLVNIKYHFINYNTYGFINMNKISLSALFGIKVCKIDTVGTNLKH